MRRRPLSANLIALAVLCLTCVIAVGIWNDARSRRPPDERGYVPSIREVVTAQVHLHREDTDGNGVHGYWVADVNGLFRIRGLLDWRRESGDRP